MSLEQGCRKGRVVPQKEKIEEMGTVFCVHILSAQIKMNCVRLFFCTRSSEKLGRVLGKRVNFRLMAGNNCEHRQL